MIDAVWVVLGAMQNVLTDYRVPGSTLTRDDRGHLCWISPAMVTYVGTVRPTDRPIVMVCEKCTLDNPPPLGASVELVEGIFEQLEVGRGEWSHIKATGDRFIRYAQIRKFGRKE